MKILFVALYFIPELYSSRHNTIDLINHLIGKGHLVSIACPNPVRGLSENEIQKYKREKSNSSFPIHRFWCGSSNGNKPLTLLKRIIIFKIKLLKYLRHNHNYDLIIIPSNPSYILPLSLMKFAKKNKIKTLFNINDIFPEIYDIKNKIMRNYFYKYNLKCINLADTIVTLSSDMKNTLIKKGCNGAKIKIIRLWPLPATNNPIDIKKYIELDENKFNVFYIGNIGIFQNLDLIFDAIKITNDIIHLYVVGSGRLVNHLNSRIKMEKLEKKITFVNRVPENVADFLYKISNLNIISLNKNAIYFACPSKTSMCIKSNKDCLMILDKSDYSDFMIEKYGFYLDSSFNAKSIACVLNQISKNHENNRINGPDIYSKEENIVLWDKLMGEIENENNNV